MQDKDNAEIYTEIALKFSAAFSFVITIFRVAVIFLCYFQQQILIVIKWKQCVWVFTEYFAKTSESLL